MIKYAGTLGFLLIIALLGAGCAPPFPKPLLEKIDRTLFLKDLQKSPEQYRGRWVMLGGMIVDAKNTKEGTLVEVLQKPLDSEGRPLRTDATDGRFIIVSDQFLDSAVYHQGREITVVGEAAGQKVLPLGEIEYRYPVVTSKDLHLWEPSAGPRFSIGVGVGVFHSR